MLSYCKKVKSTPGHEWVIRIRHVEQYFTAQFDGLAYVGRGESAQLAVAALWEEVDRPWHRASRRCRE